MHASPEALMANAELYTLIPTRQDRDKTYY